MRRRSPDWEDDALARELPGWTRGPLIAVSDEELLVAMRRGEPYSVHEFIARFHGVLMRHGRRLDLPRDECREHAAEVLHDLGTTFGRFTPQLRQSLGSYVIGTFRKRVFAEHRRRSRERHAQEEARAELGTTEQWTVGTLCSESSLRAARGHLWEQLPLSLGVERLATMLVEGLSDDELLLLAWIANRQRISKIAQWLGDKRETVTVRVWRLRDRLKSAARAHAASFDESERVELRRFFRETAFLIAEARHETSVEQRQRPKNRARAENTKEDQ